MRTAAKKQVLPARKESDIQSSIVNALQCFGWKVIRFNSGAFEEGSRYVKFYHVFGLEKPNKGLADLFAMKKGRAMFIEVKRPGKTRSEFQEDFATFVESAGIECYCVSSATEVLKLIGAIK